MVPDAKTLSTNANVAKGLHIVAYLELVAPTAIGLSRTRAVGLNSRPVLITLPRAFTVHKLDCGKANERSLGCIVGHSSLISLTEGLPVIRPGLSQVDPTNVGDFGEVSS